MTMFHIFFSLVSFHVSLNRKTSPVGVNRQTGLEPHNIAATMGCILQVSRGNLFFPMSHSFIYQLIHTYINRTIVYNYL